MLNAWTLCKVQDLQTAPEVFVEGWVRFATRLAPAHLIVSRSRRLNDDDDDDDPRIDASLQSIAWRVLAHSLARQQLVNDASKTLSVRKVLLAR